MAEKQYGRPSDETDGPPDAGTTATESDRGSNPDSGEARGDAQTADLQSQITALRSQSAGWQDRFLRKAAEFDNYRKRTEREKTESAAFARSALLQELLPILDACARAQRSFSRVEENESVRQYREGVELVFKQLGDVLAKLGVIPFDALGEHFDPNRHEALIREENLDAPENTVIEVLRPGYLYRDRLLRPAQVKVAVHSRQ
jgi:molecular chaperone GrpE